MSQRVFVTGATGVLGRRVVPRLVEAGHTVTAVARSKAKAAALSAAGAMPVGVDLFDRSAFPYIDGGDQWIDEHQQRDYFWGNSCIVAAEAAAASVTNAGGIGVVLRFALFMAPDSAHTQSFVDAARRGHFAIAGQPHAYISFIHVDDAAAAVVAALGAPAGTYNVAEPDPLRRQAHRDALSALSGHPLADPPGDGAASLARSHRIASERLRDVTNWTPAIHCIDRWKDAS
jgi:nucleoside-diphosphate-sugar epimerase